MDEPQTEPPPLPKSMQPPAVLDVAATPEIPPPPRREMGIDAHGNSARAYQQLPKTIQTLRRLIDNMMMSGTVVSVRHADAPQVNIALGEVRPSVPMGHDVMANWMSTSKVVAVIAIAQLVERKKINVFDRVVRYIPEFGVYGKELISIEHLLVHTAGIPYADVALWSNMQEWDAIITTICEANIEDVPGTKAAYHPYSSWFLLGEIIRRVDGRTFDQYVRDEIFVPLGMLNCYIGMDKATFEKYHEKGLFAELRTMTPKGKVLTKATVSTSPSEVTATVPGSNGRGPAHEWIHVFEMLTRGGVGANGIRILNAETVRLFTRRHRIGMFDAVQGILCDWSLGLFVRTGDSAQITGNHATKDTFGHGGSQSSVGFCDPVHQLTVLIFCNTRPGPKHHYERMCAIATSIYEDLGLTAPPEAKPTAASG